MTSLTIGNQTIGNQSKPAPASNGDKSLKSVHRPVTSPQEAKKIAVQRAAKEFEAMFMGEMLKPMFEGVGKTNGIFGGGHGEEAFKSIMIEQYGRMLASRGGLGIAKQVEARMMDDPSPIAKNHKAALLTDQKLTDKPVPLHQLLPKF